MARDPYGRPLPPRYPDLDLFGGQTGVNVNGVNMGLFPSQDDARAYAEWVLSQMGITPTITDPDGSGVRPNAQYQDMLRAVTNSLMTQFNPATLGLMLYQQFNQDQDSANLANEANFQNIYNQFADYLGMPRITGGEDGNYTYAEEVNPDNLNARLDDLYQSGLATVDDFGQGARDQANLQFDQAESQHLAQSAARGMGGTSVGLNAQPGFTEARNRSLTNIDDLVAQMRLGVQQGLGSQAILGGMQPFLAMMNFMNSRTDEGPDIAQVMAMSQLLGQAGGGFPWGPNGGILPFPGGPGGGPGGTGGNPTGGGNLPPTGQGPGGGRGPVVGPGSGTIPPGGGTPPPGGGYRPPRPGPTGGGTQPPPPSPGPDGRRLPPAGPRQPVGGGGPDGRRPPGGGDGDPGGGDPGGGDPGGGWDPNYGYFGEGYGVNYDAGGDIYWVGPPAGFLQVGDGQPAPPGGVLWGPVENWDPSWQWEPGQGWPGGGDPPAGVNGFPPVQGGGAQMAGGLQGFGNGQQQRQLQTNLGSYPAPGSQQQQLTQPIGFGSGPQPQPNPWNPWQVLSQWMSGYSFGGQPGANVPSPPQAGFGAPDVRPPQPPQRPALATYQPQQQPIGFGSRPPAFGPSQGGLPIGGYQNTTLPVAPSQDPANARVFSAQRPFNMYGT